MPKFVRYSESLPVAGDTSFGVLSRRQTDTDDWNKVGPNGQSEMLT